MNDIVKRTSENDGKIYHENAALACEQERLANAHGYHSSATALRHLERAARFWADAANSTLRHGVETYAHKRFDTVLAKMRRFGAPVSLLRSLRNIKPRIKN